MFLLKFSPSFTSAKQRFFIAPSLNAALQSGDLFSGNRGEGASKSQFFKKARQISIFDAPSLQLPLFAEYPTKTVGRSREYPKGKKESGSYVIPGQMLTGEHLC